jgi:hypothetical protein
MPTNKRFYDDPHHFDNIPLVKKYNLTIVYKDESKAEFKNIGFIEIENILHHEKEDEMEAYSIDVVANTKKP